MNDGTNEKKEKESICLYVCICVCVHMHACIHALFSDLPLFFFHRKPA